MKEAVEFAHRHAEPLAERPVWLFSSGPLGEEVQDDEEQPRQLSELRGLMARLTTGSSSALWTGASSASVNG